MSTAIVIMISLGVTFGGGYWLGTAKQKTKTELIIEQVGADIANDNGR